MCWSSFSVCWIDFSLLLCIAAGLCVFSCPLTSTEGPQIPTLSLSHQQPHSHPAQPHSGSPGLHSDKQYLVELWWHNCNHLWIFGSIHGVGYKSCIYGVFTLSVEPQQSSQRHWQDYRVSFSLMYPTHLCVVILLCPDIDSVVHLHGLVDNELWHFHSSNLIVYDNTHDMIIPSHHQEGKLSCPSQPKVVTTRTVLTGLLTPFWKWEQRCGDGHLKQSNK